MKKVGSVLADKLGSMQVKGVEKIVTGGTSVWLHCESSDAASALVSHLANEGVLTSAVGDIVKIQPTLLLGEQQVSELAGAIAKF